LHVFRPLKFLWGAPPEILDRDYKTEHTTEHRAKFRADRPMELGDYAVKIKENKINDSKT